MDDPAAAWTRKPIMYSTKVPIRYSDIDQYNHVGSAAYLDYIFTSRYDYLRTRFGVTPTDLFARNIGFFLAEIRMKFFKPVGPDERTVNVESHVSYINGARFSVQFNIQSEEGCLHTAGTFVMGVIDLKMRTLSDAPDWLLDLMFEPSEST